MTNSPNISEQELKELYQLFPQFLDDGKFNFEAFKTYMQDEVSENKERYTMNRHGKEEAKRTAKQPSKLTLRPQQDKSINRDETKNLFIEGDNLEVLKLLMNHYHNEVKMIYIDPPYNKDKDFVYSDKRGEPLESYLKQTGQWDEEGATSTEVEKNGRKHSNWLNMIYPRLWVSRKLLKDDGVIFVSIDDDEVANLRKIMDEIFGPENFVGSLIRKTKSAGNNDNTGINTQHEYALIYGKDKNNVSMQGDEKDFSKYTNPDNDKNGPWISDNPTANDDGRKSKNDFMITNPITGKTELPPKGRHWIFNESQLEKFVAQGKIIFREIDKPNTRAFIFKRYKKDLNSDHSSVDTLGFISSEYMNQGATKDIIKTFGSKIFEYSKPVQYLSKIIQYSTNDNDLILDFFAGSGSTAHAIMGLNSNLKSNRKRISVQLPEKINEGDAAKDQGYNTIAEISRARITKAGEILASEGAEGDLGFRSLVLDKSNFHELNQYEVQEGTTTEAELNEMVQKELLQTGVDKNRSEMDVVYELIIRQGASLNSNIIKGEDGAYTVSDDDQIFYVLLDAPSEQRIKDWIITHKEDEVCILYALEDKLTESQRINLDEYITLHTV